VEVHEVQQLSGRRPRLTHAWLTMRIASTKNTPIGRQPCNRLEGFWLSAAAVWPNNIVFGEDIPSSSRRSGGVEAAPERQHVFEVLRNEWQALEIMHLHTENIEASWRVRYDRT